MLIGISLSTRQVNRGIPVRVVEVDLMLLTADALRLVDIESELRGLLVPALTEDTEACSWVISNRSLILEIDC